MEEMETTPVLIVGAGPVGLSMALALARQGIHATVIERHSGTAAYPRTRGVTPRTMELLRQWGDVSKLLQYEHPKDSRRFIWTKSLQGEETYRVILEDANIASLSPMNSTFVIQNRVEDYIYGTLQEYKEVDVRFLHEMVSFSQDRNGVNVQIKDHANHKTVTIKAKYLIAADGAGSRIRKALGINMEGLDNLGDFCSVYAEVDLQHLTGHRPCYGYFFTDPSKARCAMLATDKKNHWIFFIRILPGETTGTFTDEWCVNLIRDVISDDAPLRILEKSFWTRAAQNATHYRSNNIFLVGDAAHRIPPTGGLGMNTGIQDAHNLAWKLAFALKYKFNPERLLNSYVEERKPVALRNIQWSSLNSRQLGEAIQAIFERRDEEFIKEKIKNQSQHLHAEGLDLGYIYKSSTILSENTLELSVTPNEYIPTTLPGSRAPYVRLIKEGKEICTLDLFEKDFVLLVSKKGQSWQNAIERLRSLLPAPIKHFRIAYDGDLWDPNHDWQDKYELSDSGAVLIRPDGFVAWRSPAMVDNPYSILKSVMEKVL